MTSETLAVGADLRNVAIIAHVDHGKTTLVDGMLRQTGTFRSNEAIVDRVLDSGDLEREKGITILAKQTTVDYDGVRLWRSCARRPEDLDGSIEPGRTATMVASVTALQTAKGIERVDIGEAGPGDIVSVAGLPEVTIGDTLTDPDDPRPLPRLDVDAPTLRMTSGVKSSPMAGRDGKFLTSRQIKARLDREVLGNSAYRAVRRRDITTHRRWMIRAFAVGLAVGTIRIWIGLFEAFGILETRDAFGVAFWISFLLHAAIAELWLFWRPGQSGAVRRAPRTAS